MSGILPLARQLGEVVGTDPIPVIEQINGPQRPTRGRWPADVWTEMEAIYATPDPIQTLPVDPGVWPLNEEQV